MSDKMLNIIAFDVPYPPNYGGICDVYYKLKNLHAAGAKIIYHCFYYEGHNPPTYELDQYCEEIHYYERKQSMFRLLFSPLPYIVSTRQDPALLENLRKNNYPILFDGIQTCFYLNTAGIKERLRLFRANNIEHDYYAGLARSEKSLLKKLYLKREARKLKKFEAEIKGVDGILCVARMDIPHFEKYAPTHHIPPFFADDEQTNVSVSVDNYVLFQGNLSVRENDAAAHFILDNIAPKLECFVVIAGKDPLPNLERKAAHLSNVRFYATPDQEKMDELIHEAQVQLLITNQQTGIKLKLLHALQSGKHIVINSKMDDDGIFASMCRVADEPEEMISAINELLQIPFDQTMKDQRLKDFDLHYNNRRNAERILELL